MLTIHPMTFTKLFASITESTIWCENDQVRIVWITMLAMANKNGFVFASIPGLANRARVSVESTREAITKFQQPDMDSRTKDFDGKRIEEVDGGWKLINYAKHRAIRDEEERKEYMANLMRKRRSVSNVSHGKPQLSQAEAEAEAEAELNPPTPLGKNPEPSAKDLEPTDAARALIEMLGVSGYTALAARDAVGSVKRRKPDMLYIEIPAFVVSLWREVSTQPKRALPSVKTFLNEIGQYIESDHWRVEKKAEFIPQVDWQGGHIAADGVYVNKHGKRVPGFICPTKPKEMAGD